VLRSWQGLPEKWDVVRCGRLEAGEAKAASIGIAYNIAVVDAGGALVAFTRQDALIGSIDLSSSFQRIA